MNKNITAMNTTDNLKINRVNHPDYGECLQLNMSYKSILDAFSPNDEDFYKNLKANGIGDFDCPIMAVPQDVADYLELEKYDWEEWEDVPDEFKAIEEKRLNRMRSIKNELGSLLYKDVEFVDEQTGMTGLLDQFGNVVVPARFDSCRGATDMSEINCYAVVEKDGQFYRTPRDGSGKLIDEKGYDKIFLNGETIREKKYGMVSLRTPEVLIPCQMDWFVFQRFGIGGIMFGKDGKIGMRDTYLHKYVSPEFSAYDISTLRFCRQGEWGWVSRATGEFFKEPKGNRYDVMILACSADDFLNYEDKPTTERKETTYISIEEMHARLLASGSEFLKHLKYKLSSLLELPALKFRTGYKASARIVEAIRSLSSSNEHLLAGIGNHDAPEILVTYSELKGEKMYRLEWSPKSNALAWHDIQLREREAFHQLILPGKETFSMRFYRDFSGREVHTMAKFIAYYYATIWNAEEDDLILTTDR